MHGSFGKKKWLLKGKKPNTVPFSAPNIKGRALWVHMQGTIKDLVGKGAWMGGIWGCFLNLIIVVQHRAENEHSM